MGLCKVLVCRFVLDFEAFKNLLQQPSHIELGHGDNQSDHRTISYHVSSAVYIVQYCLRIYTTSPT